ncbi:MAG: CHAT domain-containing protein [Bacteroidota bacterium]
MLQPVIIMAFANEDQDQARYLSNLDSEMLAVYQKLYKDFQVIQIPVASKKMVRDAFLTYGQRIKIFHFGGHAGGRGIELQEKAKENRMAFAEGIAGILADCHSLEMVFLNGCATNEQVKHFQKAQVPVVISTLEPVGDKLAKEFSVHFYQAMVEARPPKCIADAFEYAKSSLFMDYSEQMRSPQWRSLFWDEPVGDHFPYVLHINAKTPDAGKKSYQDWIASEAVSQDEIKQLISNPEHPYQASPDRHLLCDRRVQEREFKHLVKKRLEAESSAPLFVFVHGPNEELPVQLSDRFCTFSVHEIMKQLERRYSDALFAHRLVEFPAKEDFSSSYSDLPNESLKEHFEVATGANIDNASDLIRVLGRGKKLVVIQHNLMASYWHPKMEAFLEGYIDNFWQFQSGPQQPEVLVIINLTYNLDTRWFSFKKREDKNVLKSFERIVEQKERCFLLSRLEEVPKDDVVDWNNRFLNDLSLVDELFRGKQQLSMDKILPRLQAAIRANRS